jgi:superfamily II DNA or RNA helicase
MTIRLAHNAVTARLFDASDQAKLLAQTVLSYPVITNDWTGRSSFFNYAAATFPAGFAMLVLSKLTQAGFKVKLVREPFPAPLGPAEPVVDDLGDDPRYDYQREVIKRLLKHGQMIAQVATGGGKSRIAKMAVATICRKMAFLTTRSILMYQMGANFESLGHKVGVIGDGHWSPKPLINVGMVQTLAQGVELQTPSQELVRYLDNKEAAVERAVDELKAELAEKGTLSSEIPRHISDLRKQLKNAERSDKELIAYITEKVNKHNHRRLQVIAWLETLEFVILEEAHEASGNGYYEVLKHCKNAHYRLALTATPFMLDDEASNMRLMGCSGSIAIRVTEKTLIDRGILAKPYFRFLRIPGGPAQYTETRKDGKQIVHKLYRSTPWQKASEIGIVHNNVRNALIVKQARDAVSYGLSVMVLVRQKKHGKILNEMFTKLGMKSSYIFGEHDQATRQASLHALKTGAINVLIGSTILDVGVDVPAIGMVILAGGGKAEVGTRQRIGRGLREKKNGPNVAFIVDFDDPLNTHLTKHSKERQRIIATTEGFAENIVGGEFNYEGLGFRKVHESVAA